MIIYFVEFAILHILFFSVYKLILAKETQLSFLRFFLLGATLLSLIVPVLELPKFSDNVPTINTQAILLPEITVGKIAGNTGSTSLLFYSFITVSTLFFIFIVWRLLQLRQFYRKGNTCEIDNIKVREINGLQSSFTFLKWIFIDRNHFENPQDIVRHEMGHVKKLHSLDLLLCYSLTIFFWWLPSIWLMIRELKKVHEYEADSYALNISNETYIKTLVQSTLSAHGMNLASSFDDASIFNRLNFIRKMKKKVSPFKVASIMMILAISATMFACEEEIRTEIREIAEESIQQTEYSDEITLIIEQLEAENPGAEYTVIETIYENKASLDRLNELNPNQIEHVLVEKDGNDKKITVVIDKSSELFQTTIDVQEVEIVEAIIEDGYSSGEEQVFTIVEESASFPGGLDPWGVYMKSNLKYPKQAIEQGVEGRVFVQFIVQEDGSLTNLQVVKGIGAGCDEEALRVVGNSPKWIPARVKGKAVKQKMIQNIRFKIPSSEVEK